jgi:hypothetical protein
MFKSEKSSIINLYMWGENFIGHPKPIRQYTSSYFPNAETPFTFKFKQEYDVLPEATKCALKVFEILEQNYWQVLLNYEYQHFEQKLGFHVEEAQLLIKCQCPDVSYQFFS